MKKILLSLATVVLSGFAMAQNDIVISEIMYNGPEAGTDTLEFIELYNNGTTTIDLTGWSFSQGVTFTFPSVSLAAGEYMVTSYDSTKFHTTFGVASYEWTGGGLSNGGEDIVLINATGTTIDSVDYDDNSSWPSTPDGGGSSLTLCDYNSDNNDPSNWFAGGVLTGVMVNGSEYKCSPGSHDGVVCSPQVSPLEAGITLSEDTICLGTAINYTGTVAGGTAPYSTVVNFGDGSTNSSTLTGSYTYTTAGTYTLVYTATDDAIPSLTDDSTITVVVNSCVTPLDAGITLSEDTICLGTTITYNTTVSGGTAPYAYSVDYGDGSTVSTTSTGTHTYATAGTYSLVYTATDDAIPSLSKDSTITVVVDACSSINEEEENIILVYPNPSKDGLVNLSNVEANSTVTVFNVIGEVVFITIANNNQQLNLSSLNKGSYFVTIANNNKSITKKLIIE